MATDPAHSLSERIEHAAARWLARRDGEAWTPADAQALDAWLDADVRRRVAFLRLEAGWREAGRLEALGAGHQGSGPPRRGSWQGFAHDGRTASGSAPVALDRVVFAPRQRPGRRGFAGRLAAVAACALVLGLGIWAYPLADPSFHHTALGQVAGVTLAEGSEATLASDTRIEVRLSRRQRLVSLQQGEAFFDVAHHPDRAFIVEAGEQRVVALGTAFAVRRDGPGLRVVVTEGTVRLDTDAGGTTPSAVLPAGSVAHVDRNGVLVRSLPLEQAAQLTDWRRGLLVFRDTLLGDAVSEFNRYNTRKIVIVDDGIAELRIGGSFRWENAEAFVRLLEQGFPVRAEYGREQILLRSL